MEVEDGTRRAFTKTSYCG